MHYVLGHIKWFVEDTASSPSDALSLSTSEWLVIVASLVVGIGLMLLAARLLIKPNKLLDDRFKPFRNWVPTVVRWSTAVLLIASYWLGYMYAPNINYSPTPLSDLLNVALIAIAILLLLGAYTRIAGTGLLVIYMLSFLIVDAPIELLDHLEYIGLGLFLILSPSGKLSVNKNLTDPLSPIMTKFGYWALPSLKIFSGLTLIILAFSERLLNMSLADDFLVSHSSWNFLSSFGLSDRNFIILSGIVVILIGLSLILNKVVRLSTLMLLLTMIVTASLLGPTEVTGHLFAVGLVFAVWVGPNENLKFRKRHS